MDEIISALRQQMQKCIEHLQQEMGRIRTGRASLSLLDHVRVEAYAQQMPLNQLATLNIPEPRLITIQPWDASTIPAIEKAIQKAQLGLSPASDGKMIRLPIPPLTEDRRKEMVKGLHRLGEEGKVVIRNARRQSNELLKKQEKEHELPEDDVKRVHDEIQKLTDQFVAQVDETIAHKEKEVMTV